MMMAYGTPWFIEFCPRAIFNSRSCDCCPDRERSATSHALNDFRTSCLEKHTIEGVNAQCFSVSGFPVDCIRLAFDKILDKKPDLVLSGINKGVIISSDIFYSGTVAAAFEVLNCLVQQSLFLLSIYSVDIKEHKKNAILATNIVKYIQKSIRKSFFEY